MRTQKRLFFFKQLLGTKTGLVIFPIIFAVGKHTLAVLIPGKELVTYRLGIFAELMPAVLYKRGDMADWAQFCNIFGMPIREYTYDAGDETARKRLLRLNTPPSSNEGS